MSTDTLDPWKEISDFQETIEYLERCLHAEASHPTLDTLEKDVADFYSDLANQRNQDVSKLLEELFPAFREFLEQEHDLLEKVRTTGSNEEKILGISRMYQVLAEFIWDYWELLPPRARKIIEQMIPKAPGSKSSLLVTTSKFQLLFATVKHRKNLFKIYKNAVGLLNSSVLEAVKRDKLAVDPKTLDRLAKEVDSIENLTARTLLQNGLQRVSSKSDLSSFLETLHLLRSPKNAERLFAALNEVNAGTVEPQSLESLRQELNLGEAK